MFDQFDKDQIHAVVSHAIADGCKMGAEHIAAALAKPKEDVGGVAIHDVSLIELLSACKVVVESNTKIEDGTTYLRRMGCFSINDQLDAWRTLRRALGMPT